MNVNELIAKYTRCVRIQEDEIEETEPFGFGEGYAKGKIRVCKRVLKDLEQLSTIEYNRKVKIPKFVAEWIENAKYVGEWSGIFFDDACVSSEIQEWNSSNKNCDIFMSAWLNGYEVDEEPKYYVILTEKNEGDITYLNKRGDLSYADYCDDVDQLTKREVEGIDERYWPFAVPVEKEHSAKM